MDLKWTEEQFRKCRSQTKNRDRGKELKGQFVEEKRHITVNSDTVSLYNKIRVLKVACIKTEILDMEVLRRISGDLYDMPFLPSQTGTK